MPTITTNGTGGTGINWSGNTLNYSINSNTTSWTIREGLDSEQVKQLKHILTLATTSDDELVELAASVAAATDETPADALKMLKMLKSLVLIGQLMEKLTR